MVCESCGHEELALKTCRWRGTTRKEGRRFVLCDSCYAPLADSLWIVPGKFSIAARCDSCGRYCNPRGLVPETLRQGAAKRDIYTGICLECMR